MPRHNVKLKIAHEIDIQAVDVEMAVFIDGQAHGRLRASKGSFDWLPRSAQTKGFRLSWTALDKLMKENGTPIG